MRQIVLSDFTGDMIAQSEQERKNRYAAAMDDYVRTLRRTKAESPAQLRERLGRIRPARCPVGRQGVSGPSSAWGCCTRARS